MINETSIEKIRLGQNSKALFTQKYIQEKFLKVINLFLII